MISLSPFTIAKLSVLCVLIIWVGWLNLHIHSLEQDNQLLTIQLATDENTLREAAKHRQEQVEVITTIRKSLEEKQKMDTAKLKNILSFKSPISCEGSIQYLKDEAGGVTWE